MCYRPLKIINPKIKCEHSNFDSTVDPLYLHVPCGQCRTCQESKRQDWITRLAYEYEFTKAKGGFAIMDTLTYKESEVPKLHGLMCFSKEHIRTFISELRTYLTRHYEDLFKKGYLTSDGLFSNEPYTIGYKNDNEYGIEFELTNEDLKKAKQPSCPEFYPAGRVKFFITCEFGGEHGRPHYHILIFVTYKISPLAFCYYLRKAWTHGFVDKKRPQEKVINSMRGICYVAKYVCKDLEFIENLTKQEDTRFKRYIRTKWRILYGEEFNEEEFKQMPCESIKKIMHDLQLDKACPFTKSSRYIGIYGLSKITTQNLKENKCKILDPRLGHRMVSIPEYLKRKKLYDYDKNIKYWQLNETGKLIKGIEKQGKYERTIIELDRTFSTYLDEYNENGWPENPPYNKAYYRKMYKDIRKDINIWNKLIITINERDKRVTEKLKEVINNYSKEEYIQYMNKLSKNIRYITDTTDPSIEANICTIRRDLYPVEEYLSKITHDSRFKLLIKMYDILQEDQAIKIERYKLHRAEIAMRLHKHFQC